MGKSFKIHINDDSVVDEIKLQLEEVDLKYKVQKEPFRNTFDHCLPFELFPIEFDHSRIETVIEVYCSGHWDDILNKILGQTNIKTTSTYCHYPNKKSNPNKGKYWISNKEWIPTHPIFVISKGRGKNLPTLDLLEECGFFDYLVVIESTEYDDYLERVGSERLLVIPQSYIDDESINYSVRNRKYIFDYCNDNGINAHWCLDDNIFNFQYWNLHCRLKIKSLVGMCYLENMLELFPDFGQLGFIEDKFIPGSHLHRRNHNDLNTRIFSCILINNKVLSDNGINWRGWYNEDLDMSLHCLTKGIPLFRTSQIQIKKPTTLSMKGGNTNTAHKDGFKARTDYIVDLYPEYCKSSKVKQKSKDHHFVVDYKSFVHLPKGLDSWNCTRDEFEYRDYGLELIDD